ncbi:MAG: glycosyl transferase, partial [Candidatus Eisenbacteria bacterium]|nr:glycosyl transferase [Candidatus Eisenbacteria bacterium]
MKCLVIQTAYLGDVILTLPLLKLVGDLGGVRSLAVLTTPTGADFLRGQRVAERIIVYDKRGADRGRAGFSEVVRDVRRCGFGVAVIPHRSFRSALLAVLSLIPERIGFDESGGRLLLTTRVRYRERPHEIERIASLAVPAAA